MNQTQHIKVKPTSHNNRKKVRKQNWNTVTDESLLGNILKFSRQNKTSNSKLSNTISNRETHNQSHNSRVNNKKSFENAKQMMNRTVLIQNQDYRTYNPHKTVVRNRIPARMEVKKKNSLVVPKQVIMVTVVSDV